MKSASPALVAFLSSNKLGWRADLYTITTVLGTIHRWTTCDVDLTVNGLTFYSAQSLGRSMVLGRGNTRQTSKLEIDSIDIDLDGSFNLAPAGYTERTIAALAVAGYFDYARVQIDQLVGTYPGDQSLGGVLAWFEGRWAGSDTEGSRVRFKVESEIASLNVPVPRFAMQAACMNAVYDSNCTLTKVVDTGRVDGSSTLTAARTDNATIIARANGYYDLGVVTLDNDVVIAGQRRAIKQFSVSGGIATFTVSVPWTSVPAAGTFPTRTLSAYPGCPRTMAACSAFPNGLGATNNLVNFRGFPYVPRPELNR
jgi:hypothetical protein